MGTLRLSRNWQSFKIITVISALILFPSDTIAQVTPDQTLGNEKSSVNPIDALNERIDGGARRGGNLFHSFQDFNINEGKGVYFANPQGVMNIFSRVTGGNASQIFGRLGVLGQSNLFFLNPYGIIFGPNSSLDIRGSFVGSTADAVKFADGTVFSAINPQSNTLLTISVPLGLQTGNLQTAIVNRGNLVVGQDFTLSAGNLDLQGQLSAGGNLTLEALNTILITDIITNPFIAYAGKQLAAQSNNFVKISILNHRDSGLFAGSGLILRSPNPIKADAHFWSGGSFRIEKLDGSLGSLSSADDPVIRASGDVSLDSYTGASLHIFAGGSVTIPGTVTITGVESAENSIAETVTLSNGTTVVIDGSVEPTLDIRAGTLAVGSPFFDTGTPTSADISIGSIKVSDAVNGTGGKVFLTNQYQPNTALSSINGITIGAIDTRDVNGGGSVIIDARSGINLTGVLNASAVNLSPPNTPQTFSGNGGDVTLLSQGNINANSSILAQGLLGGNIILNTTADVVLDQGLEINVRGGGGGNITINAQNVSLLNASKLRAGIEIGFGTPEAQAGDIKINATGIVTLADGSLISNAILFNSIGNGGDIEIITGFLALNDGAAVNANNFGIGNGGDIEITTGFLALNDGAVVNVNTFKKGNAGAIEIIASNNIFLSGKNSQGLGSFITSQVGPDAEGNSGGIEITTGSFFLNDGAAIDATTLAKGNAGAIKITATDTISLASKDSQGNPSAIFSTVNSTAEGNSEGIEITTGSLFLTDGTAITASTFGKGNAGAIKITARDTISLSGENSLTISLPGESNRSRQEIGSLILSQIIPNAEGDSGGIEITTGSLFLSDGARIDTSTAAKGDAGAIKIIASDTISLTGESSKGFSTVIISGVGSGAEGNSGGIEITTGSISPTDGAVISAETDGTGEAGNINLNATQVNLQQARITAFTNETGNAGNITIRVQNTLTSNNSTISTSATQASGSNITISAQDIRLRGDGDIRTFVVSGAGGGGDITLTADSILAFNNSDILAFAQDGIGGNISLNTPVFFGNGYQATDQNQNPDTLDNNNRVDIDASGAVSGVISIPDLTFIQNSLLELPETLINTENLIASSCVVPNQQQTGTFILTGAEGLPTRPNRNLTSPYPTGTVETIPEPSQPKIDEPQGFYRLNDGTMVLSKKCY